MRTALAIAIFGCFTLAVGVTTSGCGKKDAASKKKGGKKKGKKGGKKKKSNYTEEAVANGGSISGSVSYAGDKKDAPAKVTKDTEVCAKAGEGKSGAIAVTDGKVKNAVVALTGITKGKAWGSDTVLVDNKDCVFVPRITVGKLGGKITAKNSDAVLHNTHLYLKEGNKNLFNIALPNKDQTIDKPLRKPGLVDIKCDAHEWMQAFVYVSAHPYVAVTGDDGSFKMTDVPAGEYTAKVWHEKLGEKEAKVKVEAGGEAKLDVAL